MREKRTLFLLEQDNSTKAHREINATFLAYGKAPSPSPSLFSLSLYIGALDITPKWKEGQMVVIREERGSPPPPPSGIFDNAIPLSLCVKERGEGEGVRPTSILPRSSPPMPTKEEEGPSLIP